MSRVFACSHYHKTRSKCEKERARKRKSQKKKRRKKSEKRKGVPVLDRGRKMGACVQIEWLLYLHYCLTCSLKAQTVLGSDRPSQQEVSSQLLENTKTNTARLSTVGVPRHKSGAQFIPPGATLPPPFFYKHTHPHAHSPTLTDSSQFALLRNKIRDTLPLPFKAGVRVPKTPACT